MEPFKCVNEWKRNGKKKKKGYESKDATLNIVNLGRMQDNQTMRVEIM